MDERTCPLCQKPNLCGNVDAGRAGVMVVDPATAAAAEVVTNFDCWCLQQTVSRTALKSLAPRQRDKSCLCQACASGVR